MNNKLLFFIFLQEFTSELDSDPFTLPEVQEHMIRSPPPTSWPRSPHFNAFNFSTDNGLTISSQSSEESGISARTMPKLNEMFMTTRSHSTMSGMCIFYGISF